MEEGTVSLMIFPPFVHSTFVLCTSVIARLIDFLIVQLVSGVFVLSLGRIYCTSLSREEKSMQPFHQCRDRFLLALAHLFSGHAYLILKGLGAHEPPSPSMCALVCHSAHENYKPGGCSKI